MHGFVIYFKVVCCC